MNNLFFKYYWDEEEVLFYIQYRDNWPFRQIEVSPKFTRYLSLENPVEGESMLGDQPLTSEDMQRLTPITKKEFELLWNKNYD